jgi:hypothetical protein
MKKQLLKALEISALTGDKVIVVDENRDRAMVVMGLNEYEDFLYGKNDDFLTKDESFGTIDNAVFDDDNEGDWEVYDKKNDKKQEDFDAEEYLNSLNIPFGEEDTDKEENKQGKEPSLTENSEDEPAEENLYYYEEPSDKSVKEEKEEGFTSIKDELKSKRKWEIPEEIKKKAEDIN